MLQGGSILQYFRPSLSYCLALRPLFCLFYTGFTVVAHIVDLALISRCSFHRGQLPRDSSHVVISCLFVICHIIFGLPGPCVPITCISHAGLTARLEWSICSYQRSISSSGLEVIKLQFILKLKMKHNDWLLADTCPQAANHCALFWVWDCTQVL